MKNLQFFSPLKSFCSWINFRNACHRQLSPIKFFTRLQRIRNRKFQQPQTISDSRRRVLLHRRCGAKKMRHGNVPVDERNKERVLRRLLADVDALQHVHRVLDLAEVLFANPHLLVDFLSHLCRSRPHVLLDLGAAPSETPVEKLQFGVHCCPQPIDQSRDVDLRQRFLPRFHFALQLRQAAQRRRRDGFKAHRLVLCAVVVRFEFANGAERFAARGAIPQKGLEHVLRTSCLFWEW